MLAAEWEEKAKKKSSEHLSLSLPGGQKENSPSLISMMVIVRKYGI